MVARVAEGDVTSPFRPQPPPANYLAISVKPRNGAACRTIPSSGTFGDALPTVIPARCS